MWKNEENNEGSFENMERSRFDAGPEFQNLLKNVSRRLGFLYNISAGAYTIIVNMSIIFIANL